MMKDTKQKLTLGRPATYRIKVPGHLDENWSGWDQKITITIDEDKEGLPITMLTGSLDQAGLQGLLLEKGSGTDDEDIQIISDINSRTVLNFKSELAFTKLTHEPVEEVADAINRI